MHVEHPRIRLGEVHMSIGVVDDVYLSRLKGILVTLDDTDPGSFYTVADLKRIVPVQGIIVEDFVYADPEWHPFSAQPCPVILLLIDRGMIAPIEASHCHRCAVKSILLRCDSVE